MDHFSPWNEGVRLLMRAALEPDRRTLFIEEAFKKMLNLLPAAGTLFFRPGGKENGSRIIHYVGRKKAEMEFWISCRVQPSLENTILSLQEIPPYFPDAHHPLVYPLNSEFGSVVALWVIWPCKIPETLDMKRLEMFKEYLEALLEIEQKERLIFSDTQTPLGPEFQEFLTTTNQDGMLALLTLARVISGADMVYWGDVYSERVIVEKHLGATNPDFGFVLPLGEGIGGRVAVQRKLFQVKDYLNSEYRYPGVSETLDREGLHSGLVFPVFGSSDRVSGILYVTRRTITPFTLAQRLLLQRLIRTIKPPSTVGRQKGLLLSPQSSPLIMKKAELRRILLYGERVEDLEEWIEGVIKGQAVVSDQKGWPYTSRKKNLPDKEQKSVMIPLPKPDYGFLNLWPGIKWPLSDWPDFSDEIAAVCQIIIERAERDHISLREKRTKWLERVIKGDFSDQTRREGHLLGLSVTGGEVWAIAWKSVDLMSCRNHILAEEVTLDQLQSPLILLDHQVGILLVNERRSDPSQVRDRLLNVLGPEPMWLIFGACYKTLSELQEAVIQTVNTIKRLRNENREYVSEIHRSGLNSLLANPALKEHLDKFSRHMLQPLLEYDILHNAQLTKTLSIFLKTGSVKETAKHLFLHENTVRYRIKRAEEILQRDFHSPDDEMAIKLACFIWHDYHAG